MEHAINPAARGRVASVRLEPSLTPADRIAKLETALAVLLDYIEAVGCYDSSGERVGDQARCRPAPSTGVYE